MKPTRGARSLRSFYGFAMATMAMTYSCNNALAAGNSCLATVSKELDRMGLGTFDRPSGDKIIIDKASQQYTLRSQTIDSTSEGNFLRTGKKMLSGLLASKNSTKDILYSIFSEKIEDHGGPANDELTIDNALKAASKNPSTAALYAALKDILESEKSQDSKADLLYLNLFKEPLFRKMVYKSHEPTLSADEKKQFADLDREFHWDDRNRYVQNHGVEFDQLVDFSGSGGSNARVYLDHGRAVAFAVSEAPHVKLNDDEAARTHSRTVILGEDCAPSQWREITTKRNFRVADQKYRYFTAGLCQAMPQIMALSTEPSFMDSDPNQFDLRCREQGGTYNGHTCTCSQDKDASPRPIDPYKGTCLSARATPSMTARDKIDQIFKSTNAVIDFPNKQDIQDAASTCHTIYGARIPVAQPGDQSVMPAYSQPTAAKLK